MLFRIQFMHLAKPLLVASNIIAAIILLLTKACFFHKYNLLILFKKVKNRTGVLNSFMTYDKIITTFDSVKIPGFLKNLHPLKD